MLRLAVVLLLLANAGYYAWSHGLLRGLGMGPASESEPQRLQQQIEPQNLRLLTSEGHGGPDTREAGRAPGEAPSCLQAGVFDARQAEALRQAAARLPTGSWSLEAVQVTGRWMVYLGRFPDEEATAKKRAELRALKVDYDRPGAALEPGLSLGRYSSEEGARRAMDLLAGQGVRRARVVQERSDAAGYTLRLPAVSEAQRAQMEATLRPALAGKALLPCD